MGELGQLWVKVGAKLDDFNRGMTEVEKSMKRVGDQLSKTGKTLSIAVTAPLMAIGGASIKMAMDAVESENLFSVSMGRMADAARKWSEELSSSLGLNQYEVRKTVGTFNVMLESMGLTETAAFDMSKGLVQLGYDMASFYNLRPDEAFEKLQSALVGMPRPLQELGIIVKEETVKTWALTHGIIKQGEELTEAQKVWARFNVIMEQTTAAQGDLARTLDSPANKLRILQSRIKETSVEIGLKLMPTFEKLLALVEKGVKWFQNLSDEQQKLIIVVAGVAAAMGPALIIAGKLMSAYASLASVPASS